MGWEEKRPFVSSKTVNRSKILDQFEAGALDRAQASDLMEVSTRQFTRLRRQYAEHGMLGLEHGLKGHTPPNKTPEPIEKQVIELIQGKYFGFNLEHALEHLIESEGIQIKYGPLKRIARLAGVARVKKRRGTRIRKQRPRYPQTGFMLQMDGSEHRWFKGEVTTLITAIDDASSEIYYGEFRKDEDLAGVLSVLRKIVEIKGVPSVLYVDRARNFGWFKEEAAMQFSRICDELGIKIIYANSPEGKGRIERAWKTLQDRLCSEFRLKNIETKEDATRYLNEKFIPKTWIPKFAVIPKSAQSAFRAAPNDQTLTEIFCRKETRQVRRDHTLVWENEWYLIQSSLTTSLVGCEVEIRVYENGLWKAFYAGRELELEKARNRRWSEFRENPSTWRKPKVEETSLYK
jgi:hypothetical protein